MEGFLNLPACSATDISLVPSFLFHGVLPKPGFVSLLAHRLLFVFFCSTQSMIMIPTVKTLVMQKRQIKDSLERWRQNAVLKFARKYATSASWLVRIFVFFCHLGKSYYGVSYRHIPGVQDRGRP